MKKILYTIMAAAAILTGCNNELIVQTGTRPNAGEGSLALDLDCKIDYTDVVTKASQSDEEIINGLTIDILRPVDGWNIQYNPFSEIRGKIIDLGSGKYELTASSPEKKDAAFDQPIFEGTKEFEIRTGEVTSVDMECKITNVMVTIVLSKNFVESLSDYTVTVTNGKGALSWSKGSDVNDFMASTDSQGNQVFKGKKAGYFTKGTLTVIVDGIRFGGTDSAYESSTTKIITATEAAKNHIMNIDANVIGSLNGVNITISDSVNDIEESVVVDGLEEKPVDGNEPGGGNGDTGEGGDDNGGNNGNEGDSEVSTAPTLEWPANPTFADVNLPMTMDAVVDVNLVINAPKLIKEFLIDVKSNVLNSAIAEFTAATEPDNAEVDTMDLIKDAHLIEGLGHLLPMGDSVKDKPSVSFSLSNLVPMINMYVESITPGDEHSFTLKVVDGEGQLLEQEVTFVSVPAE